MEMIGFFCIIIAYVLTVIVKKIREKEQAIEKQKNT